MTDVFRALLTLYLSVLVESVPFLVLGTLVSVAVHQFRLLDLALARLPSNPFLRRLCFALLGVVMPVCECGNVPLTRTLVQRGFSVGDATTFYLAAPILNPVTFITTREAFTRVPWMMPSRMIGGFVMAMVIGQVVGGLGRPMHPAFEAECRLDHDHASDGIVAQFAHEFWPLLRLLLVGGLIAAAVQTFLGQSLLAQASDSYLLAAVLMLLLGFIVSICSNVDAFFALGFAGAVPYGALLTFLLAGPMVDIKSVAMLSRTYTTRALVVMTLAIAVGAVLIGWGASYAG